MNRQISRIAMAAAIPAFAMLAGAAQAQVPLTPGAAQSGQLTHESQRITENDYFMDLYTIAGEAGERVVISMQSDEFDTYLEIGRMTDGTYTQYAYDDDGGDGLNSRLTFTFPETGEYVVRARTYGPDSTGSYTIEAGAPQPPAPPPTPIRIRTGQTLEGSFSSDSPTYAMDSYSGGMRHYALYSLRGRAGDTVTVTLRSEDFDAYLEVGGDTPVGFAAAQSNDDGGGELGLNSRLSVTFATAGTLVIRATTLGSGATGAYSLSVE